jgi:hypothetical protein
MPKMLVTDEMIVAINEVLDSEGSIIRLRRSRDTDSVRISLVIDPYLPSDAWGTESYQLEPNKEFYTMLENRLRWFGISVVHYNNTKSCFWAYE